MFVRLISQTPDIAHYVTSLSFTVAIDEFDSPLEGYDTECLVRALGSLTRLQKLDVSFEDSSWPVLTIIQEPILNLMRLPTLTHLKLHRLYNFQLSDLTLCVGLKHLDISLCSTDDGSPIEIYQDTPPRLESFNGAISPYGFEGQTLLQLCTARRTDGKPIVDATRLKRLRLYILGDGVEDLEKMLTHFTQLTSIELLTYDASLPSTGFPDLFLPPLQTLQHISLEIDTIQTLPLVSRFASTTGENLIESIKLTVNFRGDLRISNDVWSALDQVLTQTESGWKKLRSFSLHFRRYDWVFIDEIQANNLAQELKKLPVTALKGLASNKNIMFELKYKF